LRKRVIVLRYTRTLPVLCKLMFSNMLDVFVFTVNWRLLCTGRHLNCANMCIGTTDYRVFVRIVHCKARLTVSDSIHTTPHSIQKQNLDMSKLVNIFNYGAHRDCF